MAGFGSYFGNEPIKDTPSSSERTSFIDNAFFGRYREIKAFIKKYPKHIQYKNYNGYTALTRAIDGNEAMVVNLLLKSGFIINKEDKEFRNSFVNAASKEKIDILAILIRSGADINIKNYGGDTAFTYAVKAGRAGTAKYLLGLNAEVDVEGQNVKDAFVKAASNGDLTLLKMLLELGIDINSQNSKGRTALTESFSEGNTVVVKYLIKNGASIDFSQNGLKEDFVFAGYRGHTELLQELINAGADINAKNYRGDTVFTRAVEGKALNTARHLLKLGAEVDVNGSSLKDYFIKAATAGDFSMLKFLLELGIDVNCKNHGRGARTAFVGAAEENRIDVLKFLLKHKVKVDTKDQDLLDVFVRSGYFGRLDLILFLIKQGVDINAKNYCGKTVFIRAAEGGEYALIKYLVEAGANPDFNDVALVAAFIKSAGKEDFAMLKTLVSLGMDINVKGDKGETVLTEAVDNCNLSAVKYLLNNGAKIDTEDKNLINSFVSLARRSDSLPVLRLLKEKGVDINAKNYRGETALMSAAERGKFENVSYLLNVEALVDIKDGYGRTALSHAKGCYYGERDKIMQILEDAARRDKEAKKREELNRKAEEELRKIFNPEREIKALLENVQTETLEISSFYQWVANGEVDRLRGAFDAAFYDRRKIELTAVHLKIALIRENPPMIRFLINRGAKITESDLSEIKEKNIDKYNRYTSLLKSCGFRLKSSAVNNDALLLKTKPSRNVRF